MGETLNVTDLIPQKYFCPGCKKDLREVGLEICEMVPETWFYKWDGELFHSESSVEAYYESSDLVDIRCGECKCLLEGVGQSGSPEDDIPFGKIRGMLDGEDLVYGEKVELTDD
jgi:hypothetical protein